MIIINADDWGRTTSETEAALECFKSGRITSVSAMVFMEDSERAAALAVSQGVDVGLHLNLNERFAKPPNAKQITAEHERVVRYLRTSKFCQLLYNPALRQVFPRVFQAQYDEFVRLYGRRPSHVDGHQHMHLCGNMLIGGVIPKGERVRRNFSFWPGEKSLLNRAYRRMVDRWIEGRFRTTDYFFALSQNLKPARWPRLSRLASEARVELMTHPAVASEFAVLMSEDFRDFLRGLELKTYAEL
jgi:predicted glycoside hydrolase/deacetylase ChbG (UPF0249 family)